MKRPENERLEHKNDPIEMENHLKQTSTFFLVSITPPKTSKT